MYNRLITRQLNFKRKDLSMRFQVKENNKTMSVALEQDGEDVNFLITDANGEEHTIAFLNGDGLTLCALDEDIPGFIYDDESTDYIRYQEDG